MPFLVVALLLTPAPAAQATFHEMSIREVYSGTADNSSYVELQMYSPGQNLVNGHKVTIYDAGAALLGTFEFTGNVANSQDQRTILVGDSGVQSAFGVAPDLTNSSIDVPAAGGAACFESIDCVSWGSFSGSVLSATGTPEPGGIPSGMAIRRSISGGSCTNQLDPGDDTNDSAADFSSQSPNPRNNASAIIEGSTCTPPSPPPTAIIDTKPPSQTNQTSAAFTYHSNPAGATFECRLDAEAFAACEATGKSYAGPISEGSHTFQVKATNANGTGSPAGYTWTIDLTAPTVTINSHPLDPSPGNNAAFTYSSNELESAFECSLATGGPDSFSGCANTGKTYSGLADGTYTFKVRAKDKAGNLGSAAEYSWLVDNSLADTTPPQTTIVGKPPNPSESPNASFSYESSEPGSTFECKLDSAAFAPCEAAGISYTGLSNGPHSFQVRATDSYDNTDESPAGYSWEVAVPSPAEPPPAIPPSESPIPGARAPETKITSKPRARTRDRTPTLRFKSSLPGARFQCRVDGKRFKSCRSPFTTPRLKPGRHVVRVRALTGGAVDPTPASCRFKVLAKKGKKNLRRKRSRKARR